jgi:glycosyltransferase involved in cell wall biosynthesis
LAHADENSQYNRAVSMHSNDRATIAVVMRAFEGGGAQRDMVLLCNALVALRVPVVILALSADGPLRNLLDPSIRIIENPGRRIRYAIPGLRRAIRAVMPRLVVSSESNLNLFSLVAVRSLPRAIRPKIVLREVGSPSIARLLDPHRQNRVAYRALRYAYRYADRIITLTDGARRDLIDNFAVSEQAIAVMQTNAVIPPDAARRIAQCNGEGARERGLIVSVGRLSPEKDHRSLLHAMTLLRRDRQWRLAVVGDGPERSTLEALALQYGLSDRITFTGYVSDPFAWMMRATLAVCSSTYEGLCNALIEALGCGTPVVSTDCPYGPREILQGGRFGALVPVGDAPALAAAIEVALEQPVDRHRLMLRGLDYTSERAAASFLEIINDL